MQKIIHIFGGGTVQHVRNHLAICAPAYGGTARALWQLMVSKRLGANTQLHLTKMADHQSVIETNNDVAAKVSSLLKEPTTAGMVFNVALCDYDGMIGDVPSGKYAERLQSRAGEVAMRLTPAQKILGTIKTERPDIFLVGFKTTAAETTEVQLEKSKRQARETGADVVWANDTVTRKNQLLIMDPERTGNDRVVFSDRKQLQDRLVNILAEEIRGNKN